MNELYLTLFLMILACLGYVVLFPTTTRKPSQVRVEVRTPQKSEIDSNGFTAIELMVVIAMIGILTSVCYPTMKSWRESNKINSSAMDIKSILEMAKSQAIKNQKPVAVSFSAGTGSAGAYRAFTNIGKTDVETFDEGAGDELYKDGSVKKDVTLFDADFEGDEANTVVFSPLGLATSYKGSLKLRNKKGDIFKMIEVTSGGTIRIKSSTTGLDDSWSS